MKKDPTSPLMPYDWDADIPGVAAIKACDKGVATPEQQKLALTTIIEGICGYYDISFRPDSDRLTAFAEGKRFVGAQIVKLTKLNITAINKAREDKLNGRVSTSRTSSSGF